MGDYELYHASTRKHKYIKKIGNRYFYTQQEIQAYLKKTKGKVDYATEAVAEATGRRDVYWEAPKVTENGHTFYDDEAAKLRTGKMDKKGKTRTFEKDGKTYKEVYTDRGTNQYENDYTKELNAKTRTRGKKKLKKMATKPVRSMKKQASKGKKALDRWNKKRAPRVTVVQSISEDKNYKRQNGQRG